MGKIFRILLRIILLGAVAFGAYLLTGIIKDSIARNDPKGKVPSIELLKQLEEGKKVTSIEVVYALENGNLKIQKIVSFDETTDEVSVLRDDTLHKVKRENVLVWKVEKKSDDDDLMWNYNPADPYQTW